MRESAQPLTIAVPSETSLFIVGQEQVFLSHCFLKSLIFRNLFG